MILIKYNIDMMKVSFDFDNTLDREDVQRFAKELVETEDVEVWITTSRKDVYTQPYTLSGEKVYPSNSDLFKVADEIGISHDRVIFTCLEDKVDYLEGKDFVFHLDDDDVELMLLLESTDSCIPLNVDHVTWRHNCRKALKKKRFKLENS